MLSIMTKSLAKTNPHIGQRTGHDNVSSRINNKKKDSTFGIQTKSCQRSADAPAAKARARTRCT